MTDNPIPLENYLYRLPQFRVQGLGVPSRPPKTRLGTYNCLFMLLTTTLSSIFGVIRAGGRDGGGGGGGASRAVGGDAVV